MEALFFAIVSSSWKQNRQHLPLGGRINWEERSNKPFVPTWCVIHVAVPKATRTSPITGHYPKVGPRFEADVTGLIWNRQITSVFHTSPQLNDSRREVREEILTCLSPEQRESWIIKIQMNLNAHRRREGGARMQSCGVGSKLKGFGRELNKVYLGRCSLSCLVVCEGSGATQICRKWESGRPICTNPLPLVLSAPQPNTLVQLLSTSGIGRRPWDTAAVCPGRRRWGHYFQPKAPSSSGDQSRSPLQNSRRLSSNWRRTSYTLHERARNLCQKYWRMSISICMNKLILDRNLH